MKFITLFIVLFAATSPLLGMTADEKAGVSANIADLVNDLRENGSCVDKHDGQLPSCERPLDILLLLVFYTKPENENDENLIDCLQTLFKYVRSVHELEKTITPKLVAQVIKHLKISVNEINKCGFSLLHDAAFVGDNAVIETLCLAGANVTATNDHWTPLHIAASSNHADACRILLEHKAPINAKNHLGETALHIAAEEGYAPACQVLLQAKADVTIKNNNNKPAIKLVPEGRRDIVKLFLTIA